MRDYRGKSHFTAINHSNKVCSSLSSANERLFALRGQASGHRLAVARPLVFIVGIYWDR
jgi:hypothetical protein